MVCCRRVYDERLRFEFAAAACTVARWHLGVPFLVCGLVVSVITRASCFRYEAVALRCSGRLIVAAASLPCLSVHRRL